MPLAGQMAYGKLDQISLSDAVPFEFELISPGEEVATLVNTFFVIRSTASRLDEMMPAYSAQLMLFARGRSELVTDDGKVHVSDTVCSTAPMLCAAPITLHGPVEIIGASLTPLGWQCLSQTPADELNNCAVSADCLLDPEELASLELLASRHGEDDASPRQCVDALTECLFKRAGRLDPAHVQFVTIVTGWLSASLNPALDDLYETVSMSERSVQRLCKRYFGVSPSHLIKRFRAIRAAMILANPAVSESVRDELFAGYFDQAHLIHDIRRFTGRTPGSLKEGSAIQWTLDPEAHGEAARILRD